jgi:hypothetical protein
MGTLVSILSFKKISEFVKFIKTVKLIIFCKFKSRFNGVG